MKLEDIDIYNPDNYVDAVPYDQLAFLRENAPVFKHKHPDGKDYWALTRHADCVDVSRNHKTFSSEKGFVLLDDLTPELLTQVQEQLLGMDPPKHGPIRRSIITRFTSTMLEAVKPRIRIICNEIFDTVANGAEVEFVHDIASKLPMQVVGELMAVPKDKWEQLASWAEKATGTSDPDISSPEETQDATMQMGIYGFELACERKGKDGDDLISLLINEAVEGHELSEMEFASLFVQIAVAGHETTRSLISSGLHQLIQHPVAMAELRQAPELLPRAVEEMLRYAVPLHYFRRTAVIDTEVGGQKIQAGDRVVLVYSAANRDPAVFSKPDEFNIHREGNQHLSFGHGIHLCLGANLARLETVIFFEEFFKTFSSIELTGQPARIRSNLVNGFKRMPVRLRR